MGEASPPPGEPGLGVVGRPPGQLYDYPIDVRWEVTRRHPYYQVFWREAKLYCSDQAGDEPARAQLRYAAFLILGAIGVAGEPLDPGTSTGELMANGIDSMFLTGAVQPLTFRAILSMLLRNLPRAECESVADLISGLGEPETETLDEDGRRRVREMSLAWLSRTASPFLDSVPKAPLFYVHMGASQRSIVRDMEDQVRLWQARRGIEPSKVQSAKLADYLEVWDLRERWTGSAYDASAEPTFADVAQRLGIASISTVANRYKAAFAMITGHEFTPELWWRLFGPLKYSKLIGDPAAALSAPIRRHLRSPARRPAPDSRVSPASERPHDVGLVEAGSAVGDFTDAMNLFMDLEELIERGLGDEEIAEKLDLEDPGVVASARARIADFGSL
jgi:hypothetical protein